MSATQARAGGRPFRGEAFILDAVRSPMGKGKEGGALSSVHPVDLLGQVLKALVERNDVDPGLVEDVIAGCVGLGGEQSSTPARMAWLSAGFPAHVPGVTVERKCGSGQQAADFASFAVMAGMYDVVVAGGIESMSRVPMGSQRMGKDRFGQGVRERYAPGLVPQGVSAELVADRWGIGRRELDEFAVRSHLRAAAAAADGSFDGEIVPIAVADGTVGADETIRPHSTVEKLAELKPAFASPKWTERFPDLSFQTTAGNSSQLTDGASAMLIASEAGAEQLGLRPRARFVAASVVGDDPLIMLSGPIPATRKALERAGLTIEDIDHFEVNEAFASVPLAWQKELGVPSERLNPRGGAIALGHPLGASGARLMTTMLHTLEQTGGRFGLQTMCEGGGMANATVIERL
ncbi:MAG TPA: thiolase family protein [Solirubrobacterales bacterium]|jgi:acetyl-CoA acetyltransferase family protein|nr:thiolase family protein [Solirubrobacterales bacterium]